MANLSAMTLFLWHQTAFLAVTMAGCSSAGCRACTPPRRRLLDRRAAGLAAGLRGRAARPWLVFRRGER